MSSEERNDDDTLGKTTHISLTIIQVYFLKLEIINFDKIFSSNRFLPVIYHFVEKSKGIFLICVDYRRLNLQGFIALSSLLLVI